QRSIETQLAIRECGASRALPLREQLPQDAARNVADQIFAVEENRVIVAIVGEGVAFDRRWQMADGRWRFLRAVCHLPSAICFFLLQHAIDAERDLIADDAE